MKTGILTVIALLSLFTNCNKSKTLLFSSIRQIDITDAKKGSSYNLSFYIKNQSINPIKLGAINSSCGCVIAMSEKDLINANDSVRINLLYEPRKLGLDKQILTIKDTNKENLIEIPIYANVNQ